MKFNFGSFGNFGGFSQNEETGEYHWTPPQRQGGGRPKKMRRSFSRGASLALSLAVTLVFGLGYFYFELPALNFHAEEFYVFLFLLCAVYCVCAVLTSGFQGSGVKGYFGFVKKQCTIPFFVLVALIAASVLKLGKSNLKDALSVCIFLAVLLLAFFVDLSPVILIVCAGVVGYVARMIAGMKKGGADQ